MRRRRGIGGFLFRWVLLILVGVGLAGTLYSIHLDRVVRGKFEGQRWALPARVFARPLELYADRPLLGDQLQAELDRLNYRRTAAPDAPAAAPAPREEPSPGGAQDLSDLMNKALAP